MKSEPILSDKRMRFNSIYVSQVCLPKADIRLNQRLFLDALDNGLNSPFSACILQKWCSREWGMVDLIGESGFRSRLLSSCSSLEIMRFVKSL